MASREELDRFQAAFAERRADEPLWLAVDRAVQAALMSLGTIAPGVAAAITRLASEFEAANTSPQTEFRPGKTVRLDALAMRRLAEAYLRARVELASTRETEMNLPFFTADEAGPKHFQRKLTAQEIAALEFR